MHEKHKILHILTERGWRGGEAQAFFLCRGLLQQGFYPIICTPKYSEFAIRAQDQNVPIYEIPKMSLVNLPSLIQLRRIIKKERPVLIHCHTARAHSLALAAIIGNSAYRKRPIIVSRRVDFAVSHNPFSRWKYLNPRVHYIAISRGVKDVLLQADISEKHIDIVNSGIDPERFKTATSDCQAMRRELAVPEHAFVIGNVAALTDHKGHRFLIDAAALVHKTLPNSIFLIAGEGEERVHLEAQIQQLNLGSVVQLLGYRNDIGNVMKTFDIFVLSSHKEGLCTSLLDAMLFEIPVIATCTGGVPDAVIHNETGILVEPKDSESLAEAIIFAYNNQDLIRSMASHARQRVMKFFTVDRMVAETIKVYQKYIHE